MIRRLLMKNLFVGAQSKPRRRTSTIADEGVMQLEVRRMLSADISAQVVGGTLFLNGSAAGNRSLAIIQDTNNPGLLDIEPQANTTINGSTHVYQVPTGKIQHDISISLNNGSSASNSTLVIFDTNSFVLPGNLGLNLAGNGKDTIALNHGNVQGALFLTTGAGNDSISVNHMQINGATFINSGAGDDNLNLDQIHSNGNTFIDTGVGNDRVFIGSSTLANAYVTERGAQNDMLAEDSSMSSISVVEQGSQTTANFESLTISGSLSITQYSGYQQLDIGFSNIAGAVSINQRDAIPGPPNIMVAPANAASAFASSSANQKSLAFLFYDSFGSLSVHGGNGDYLIETVHISVMKGVAITLRNGNSDVGMFATGQIGGTTSISIGKGNSTVVIVGLTDEFNNNIPNNNISTYAGIAIHIGNGQSSIALNSLNATSFNATTGQGSSFVGIGGQIHIPSVSDNSSVYAGGTFSGGPVTFSGPVQITSFGPNNTAVINQSSFQNSFSLFDFSGNDTLMIDASIFNGPFSSRMGGIGNAVKIAPNPSFIPITTNDGVVGATNVIAYLATIFNGPVSIRFPNAPSVGGGGTVTLGVPFGAGVFVNEPFGVLGGSVKESAELIGAANLKLVFSKLI